MSSSTKGPWDEMNLKIINMYKENFIVMEETSWKKILVDVDLCFFYAYKKPSYLQNAILCL